MSAFPANAVVVEDNDAVRPFFDLHSLVQH